VPALSVVGQEQAKWFLPRSTGVEPAA